MIAGIVNHTLNFVVEQCILNPSRCFWLLSNALISVGDAHFDQVVGHEQS